MESGKWKVANEEFGVKSGGWKIKSEDLTVGSGKCGVEGGERKVKNLEWRMESEK